VNVNLGSTPINITANSDLAQFAEQQLPTIAFNIARSDIVRFASRPMVNVPSAPDKPTSASLKVTQDAEWKVGGGYYSAEVDARMAAGLGSVSATLTLTNAREDVPSPPAVTQGFTTQATPYDAMSLAFGRAFAELKDASPTEVAKHFPKLLGHFKS